MAQNTTWEIKSSTGKHFEALDGLRGIAILMVCAVHTIYLPDRNSLWIYLQGIIKSGRLGVEIFFVLSGFLISYPIFVEREENPGAWFNKNYLRRRIGKIAPPFYLSLVILVAVFYMFTFNRSYLWSGLLWSIGAANFVPPPAELHATYWSLPIEVQFYILLPILVFALRKKQIKVVSVVLFLLFLVVPFVARHLTWPTGQASRTELEFVQHRFPCCLDYFGWGILFAAIFVQRPNLSDVACRRLGYAGAFLLIATCITFGLWLQYCRITEIHYWSEEGVHLFTSLATFLMLFFVFVPESIGAKFLSVAPLRFTGIISYEWFLFHLPVVYYFQQTFPQPSKDNIAFYLLKTAVPLALTYVLSALVYRYFSLPIRRWILNWGKKQETPASVETPRLVAN